MAQAVKMDKLMEVANLIEGDKVKLTNGDVATFVRLKQKNFVGTMNGQSYNIPVNMFVEVVEKVDFFAAESKKEEQYSTLKKGELFYITDQKKGNALLFIFEEMKNGKIIGISPINNTRTRIAPSLFAGRVSDIKA